MFTGIIETTAKIKSIKKTRNAVQLTLDPQKKLRGVRMGESIAVNGVCLTVVKKGQKSFAFDVIPETFRRSNLSQIRSGTSVNLERSLKYGDRVSGHYVLGHIEGTGRIQKITRVRNDVEFRISLPKKLKRFLIPKGCIAVDGISLTVGQVTDRSFNVYLIPHTLQGTNLKERKTGDPVNLETDILLRSPGDVRGGR